MDSSEDLSDWVAVKANIFVQEEETDHPRFICAWNEEASKIAITLHEGSRKASDQNHKNKVCLLSLTEIYHIHRQFYLINTSLSKDFPDKIKPNYVPSRKKFEYVSTGIEHYLSCAVKKVGKKLVISLVFGDDDPLACYEENWNEFKLKSLEDSVDKAYKELEEILSLRGRAESLLQVITIYALEDQVCTNISDYLSEMYNFHLQPFLELREMSRARVNQAKEKLGEEIGPNIRQKAQKDFEEWNEQSLVATEAIQQLYQEFYRKTLHLVTGQRNRMLEDKKKFGKVAFGLHAIPRLLKLEVQVCQEDLKLHNAIKATREYQRDKIKSQLTYLSYDYGAVREIEMIEEEIINAQISVFDAHLDVLEVEERLYKSQLAVFNKEYKDTLDTGVFFDAAENPEDMPDIESDEPEMNPNVAKLKLKLSKIYQKRAVVRNKKKNMVAGIRKKKAVKAAVVEKHEKIASYSRKRKESKAKELPADKLAEERKKTLQRLKEFKKKQIMLESKAEDGGSESEMTRSFTGSTNGQDTKTYVSQRKKSLKPTNQKETNNQNQTHTTSTIPPPPPLPPFPGTTSTIPPPPSTSTIPPPPPFTLPQAKLPTESISTSVKPPINVPAEISQSSIADQLKALKKTSPPEEGMAKKPPPPGNGFSLNEILSIRSKLKAPSADFEKGKVDTPMDLSTILQATMKRIRNITEDSELESDSSNSDFD